jgi:hypothetical protein
MFNVHTEMPSGARSRGYERKTEEEAVAVFDQMVSQCRAFPNFVADVVMFDEQKEIRREHIANAER